jgi:omega-amidase
MNSNSGKLRVGVVQYNILQQSEHGNFHTIRDLIRSQINAACDLFVLPEVCLTGFGAGKKAVSFKETEPLIQSFVRLSQEVGAAILAGFRIREGDQTFNRCLWIDGQGIQMRYDKRVLFSYWREGELFAAGCKSESYSFNGFTIAPFICYELRFPELFRAQMGAHLMTVIANWPQERRQHWMTLLKARAIENQCYVIGVNRVGTVGDILFSGDSAIIDPLGREVLQMEDRVGVGVAELDLSEMEEYRSNFPVFKDAP